MSIPTFDVSTAVAVLNQTLEFAMPTMVVVGEISEFRVSKGKWVYFDIKDEQSKLKCFGTVYQLKMPLQDGMQIEVIAQPRLHNLYGFSLNIQAVRPVGEGSIKKSSDLLRAQLQKEGLFDVSRKRMLPYPPERIALIASGESAAYADFQKIIAARWPLLEIDHFEVHVQGQQAEEDIIRAISLCNEQAKSADVLVLIRGGGSADDLQAFSIETVARAVASSRIPTLVAIGHEIDESLAELVADVRASTPSNAAELLVPDVRVVQAQLRDGQRLLWRMSLDSLQRHRSQNDELASRFRQSVLGVLTNARKELDFAGLRLKSYHPEHVLRQGYALVRQQGLVVRDTSRVSVGTQLNIELAGSVLDVTVNKVHYKDERQHG